MIRYRIPEWTWRPMQLTQVAPSQANAIEDRLLRVLESWRGTRYMSGQQCKGVKADCIGFVFGVVDEMYGRPSPDRTVLPADTAMHSREKAIGCMKTLRRLYMPNVPINQRFLEPGDIVVTGHSQGGPGHVMIVGPGRNTLWHCNEGIGVAQTGLGLADGFQSIFGVFRFLDREKWQQ